ncbi:MAG TPA: hypothetical protein VL463_35350 [Kofleriaceae bacterium]|jgi:hypothetical protein|nr:hypothetical protein [Kofleriaceae bacterium]
MPSLVERLGVAPTRDGLIADCVVLIDAQVKNKGLMMRTAYGTIKTIKRGFVKEVVDGLLDDWLAKLQPHYDKWSAAKAGSFAEFLIARSDDVAEDLLSVTDRKAETTKHTTAKKLYLKFRDGAKRNVIEAIPELGKTIEKHLSAEAPTPTKSAPASA